MSGDDPLATWPHAHFTRYPVFWSSRSDVRCTCSDEDRRLPEPDPDRL